LIKRVLSISKDWLRHCERSEAIHAAAMRRAGLLRRFARNDGSSATRTPEVAVAVTVFIRYQIDPFKRAMFEQYARAWLTIIPKAGGDLIGYWMPHEGTNNIAFALISFESLASYENYRARLRSDDEGIANFGFAEENQFIVAEERTFLRQVIA
jgi:NIPSNAP